MSRASQTAAFYAELATLLGAGVPLGKALESLRAHASDRGASRVAGELLQDCAAGMPLAEAMARQPRAFEPFEVSVVRAGDRAGRLPEVLRPLSAEWERRDQGRRRVLGAVIYPVFLLHLAAVAGAAPALMGGGGEGFLRSLIVTLGVIYGVGAVLLFITRPQAIRSAERVWMSVPVVGRHLKNTWLERFLLVLRLQTDSGALYSEALPEALQASGSATLEAMAPAAQAAAERGDSLMQALEPVFAFAPELRSFFATAETSGRVSEILGFVEARVREVRERSGQLLVSGVPKLIYFIALGWAAWTVISGAMNYYGAVNGLLDGLEQ